MKKLLFLLIVASSALQANQLISVTKKVDFAWWTNRSKPALIIITAPWCQQCKQLKKWLATQDFKGVTFLVIDSKDARRFKAGPVRSLPTIIAYKNGARLFAEPVLDSDVIKASVVRSLQPPKETQEKEQDA